MTSIGTSVFRQKGSWFYALSCSAWVDQLLRNSKLQNPQLLAKTILFLQLTNSDNRDYVNVVAFFGNATAC